MELEGIGKELKQLLHVSLDQAPERRRVREAFKEIQLGIDHCLLKVSRGVCLDMFNSSVFSADFYRERAGNQASYPGLKTEELYKVNSRGLTIFTKSWLPETSLIKAIICFCHGYGDTCTFFFEGTAKKLASSGFGVFALDYPGFGLSEGLHCFIPSFDRLVDDVIEHFSSVKENPDYKSLPSFLLGESMGGAVVLKMHLKQPHKWDGAILVAPMCKIADDIVPPWLVKQFLIHVAKFLPKGKLVPQKDIAEMAFKDLKKRKLAAYNVIAYKGKPRLRTAVELLKATEDIGNQLDKVSLPIMILHGEADIVTDPSVSKALYETASSADKTLRLYKDAYHALLEGECDEMIFRVFEDIITWLDNHSIRNNTS